ncbi:proline racemase family protein, partial [Streptomyces lunaelactis]|uniref:proline racemase family protein n=1 Tax=Streptomyces lunaelactis TaxID=1535768 RepID=UPI001584FF33
AHLPPARTVDKASSIGPATPDHPHVTGDAGGRPAVLPTVTGRAWITGTAQYLLDPTDPFPGGFLL